MYVDCMYAVYPRSVQSKTKRTRTTKNGKTRFLPYSVAGHLVFIKSNTAHYQSVQHLHSLTRKAIFVYIRYLSQRDADYKTFKLAKIYILVSKMRGKLY